MTSCSVHSTGYREKTLGKDRRERARSFDFGLLWLRGRKPTGTASTQASKQERFRSRCLKRILQRKQERNGEAALAAKIYKSRKCAPIEIIEGRLAVGWRVLPLTCELTSTLKSHGMSRSRTYSQSTEITERCHWPPCTGAAKMPKTQLDALARQLDLSLTLSHLHQSIQEMSVTIIHHIGSNGRLTTMT